MACVLYGPANLAQDFLLLARTFMHTCYLQHLRLRLASFVLLLPALFSLSLSAEPLPGRLQGTWRITRVLPTSNTGCWDRAQAEPLVGSSLTYRDGSMRWRGGSVSLEDVTTRNLTATEFARENGGAGSVSFAELGIRAAAVTEVDLQHEDMDITGASTEVPGDSVLLAGPNRIVVSACGVYFEATRAAGLARTSFRH